MVVRLFEDLLCIMLIEIFEFVYLDWINWVCVNFSCNLIIVLIGGGVILLMVKKLVEGMVIVYGVIILVVVVKVFLDWLCEDYFDLEDYYFCVVVLLGGVCKNIIYLMGVLKVMGIGIGGY